MIQKNTKQDAAVPDIKQQTTKHDTAYKQTEFSKLSHRIQQTIRHGTSDYEKGYSRLLDMIKADF